MGQSWQQWDRERVNQFRAEHGKPPLKYRWKIQQRAQTWANEMALGEVPFSDDGQPGAQVCWSIGGKYMFGANVAKSSTSIYRAQQALENSPPHVKNMLGNYKWFGAGAASRDGWYYISQEFCR